MMEVRGLETGYQGTSPAAAWPVQPWAALAPAAEGESGEAGEAGSASALATAAGPRKARDRGASAVEWVVITAIVVAIVTGVGVLISDAVKAKAKNTCTQITSTDTTTGGSSAGCA